jgi:hypothetical protein
LPAVRIAFSVDREAGSVGHLSEVGGCLMVARGGKGPGRMDQKVRMDPSKWTRN